MTYPTNWKKMQIFDYKCHSNLPLDIQKLIILYSEDFWYDQTVDKIIKNWYAYIGKKIVAQYIYSKIEIQPTMVYPYMDMNNIYVEPIIIYIIDPLKNYNQIIHICKILKGTEDRDFWWSFLEKVACGLQFIYKEFYELYSLPSWLLSPPSPCRKETSTLDIIRINKLVTINNYIVNVRDKFLSPLLIGSFMLQTLMNLKEQSHIPIYS